MRVLVTGGCGFIGSNVVELLLKKNTEVFVLDNSFSTNFNNLEGLDCEVISGDILDENLFKKLPHLDAVINQAAITDTTFKDNKKMMMVNFVGFKNVLHHCLKKRVKLVYASSAGVYGNGSLPMREQQRCYPLNTYAYSKFLCDKEAFKLLNKKNIPLIVGLRYFNVYGHREYHKKKSASMIYQLYLQMEKDMPPRIFKFGKQKRDFIYVKDVALATVKVLDLKKSSILNVGTGEAHSFNKVIAVINKVLKKNLSPQYFSNPYTKVYQNYTQADTTILKKELKFSANYSLEEGIKDYITNYLRRS